MFLCLKCRQRYENRGWECIPTCKPPRRGCERCQLDKVCLDLMSQEPQTSRKLGRQAGMESSHKHIGR